DIVFNCTQSSATGSSDATITVQYQGLPITNCQVGGTQNATCTATGYPAAKPIAVTNINGCTNTVADPLTIGPTSVANASGQVVVSVPAQANGVGSTCSFTLTGVLLGLAGSGATSVNAAVSVSPGNNLLITAGQNNPQVVTQVQDAIAANSFAVTHAG